MRIFIEAGADSCATLYPSWKTAVMRHLLSQLVPLQMKRALRRVFPWRHVLKAGIRVHYMDHLVGDGATFGQGFFLYLLNRGMPKQTRTFEWCAGPGFIGFSLLGAGLTETLCLADINPQAVDACRRSIKDNALAARVNVYQSDNLANIPQSEQWDLVVGNPPWFSVEYAWGEATDLKSRDLDWHIHRTFFSQIGGHLKPGGIIILQENNNASTSETFRDMISSAGLDIVFVEFGSKRRTPFLHIYYLGIARRGDAVPDWARGSIFSS
jgi:16S rRNA G966 N2-methylase RsmD